MRVERPVARRVASELASLRDLAPPLAASAGAEEIRLRAPAPGLRAARGDRRLEGGPVATSVGLDALGHAVARIGPALASGAALAGVEPAVARSLGPRLDAVRRMANVVADLLVLGDAAAAERRATRTA